MRKLKRNYVAELEDAKKISFAKQFVELEEMAPWVLGNLFQILNNVPDDFKIEDLRLVVFAAMRQVHRC